MALEWVPIFLEALSRSPNVTAAAAEAGISRQYAYEFRESHPEFAQAWKDALEQSTDTLVGEMFRRAVRGTRKPVFYLGEECGHIQEYSDTLAIFLAKTHRPEVYGDRSSLELTGKGGGPVELAATISQALAKVYGSDSEPESESRSDSPEPLPDGGS